MTATVLNVPLTPHRHTRECYRAEIFGFTVELTRFDEGWSTSVVGWGASASLAGSQSIETAAVGAEKIIRARAGEMRGLLELVSASRSEGTKP
jgi:hypothetical protein